MDLNKFKILQKFISNLLKSKSSEEYSPEEIKKFEEWCKLQ